MEPRQKGLALIEILFWLAILALVVGGFVYKNTKKLQEETLPPKEQKEGSQPGDVVRILNSDRINKEKLIEEY